MSLIVRYDPGGDVLYIAVPGELDHSAELYPDINVDMNGEGDPIGIELLGASRVLKDAIEPLYQRVVEARVAAGSPPRAGE
ncbi:MAG: DUF2283 domain-containing protein [Chloroflexi bacterium]|nr:DUF2283 domain-containing protein [Chloroflexota bacterium]MBI4503931.1 DUF2283 domain-containing protein [Chloroflexota bacterium]